MKLIKRGNVFIETTVVSALVMVALAMIANHYYQTQKIYKDVYGDAFNINEEVRKWKKEAPYIIVGKITKIYDTFNVQGLGAQDYLGFAYYDILAQAIERGFYPGKMMHVEVGLYSSHVSPEVYPPYLKRNYQVGDRIKIFVYYDEKERKYISPGGYYTIEPI